MISLKKIIIFPSWVIYIIESFITLISVLSAILIRDNFIIPANFSGGEYWYIPISVVAVRALFFYIFGTYKSLVRYTNTKDIMNLCIANISGSFFMLLLNLFSRFFILHSHLIPFSIIIVEFFFTTFLIILYRLFFKTLYIESVNPKKWRQNILIYGAGIAGVTTKRALDRDTTSKYNVVAFIDDDVNKIDKKIENLKVYSLSKLETLMEELQIAFVIIAIKDLSAEKKQSIIDRCLWQKVKVLTVPPVNKWINGELSFKQIKKVKIEDLLGRDPICLDEKAIRMDLTNKIVLITGAAGSIGSEIVRQVAQFNVKKLILVDIAETAMFYLNSELKHSFPDCNFDYFVVDIKDESMMDRLMKTYHPDIVYHAAAYKHVPVMELNPRSAVMTNVFGTKNIADLAVKYSVDKFVMISTDKAVNPTNIMGATKRIAEIYVQSLNRVQQTTKFITTRFGNVLGSNGSVIPIFKRQIEEGGPITITHPEVTRYFMTIPEACQLVLNAGSMGNGGEIFIFDMGQSVKIMDLAVNMIRLSGLTLGKDIQIIYTGMRPGEKLYEELLANQENTIKTNHEKIMIAKVREYDFDNVKLEIETLRLKLDGDTLELVRQIKHIVPEFISKNSIYESLDLV